MGNTAVELIWNISCVCLPVIYDQLIEIVIKTISSAELFSHESFEITVNV